LDPAGAALLAIVPNAGSFAARVQATKDATATNRYLDLTYNGTCTAGLSYSLNAWYNAAAIGSGFTQLYLIWFTAGWGYLDLAASSASTATGIQQLSVTGTAPATAANVQCFLRYNSSTASDVCDIYWDAVKFEQASAPGIYFDGATPGAAWTGTAHASTSTWTPKT
jgi:hypothetical protein